MTGGDVDPTDLIELLGLEPHPEGGYYAETWRAASSGGRPTGTAIYFLLTAAAASHWHRVDAAEIWHHYGGAPLRLSTWTDGATVDRRVLGADLVAGERPQLVVAPGQWQAAETLGAWTLAGCTVSPGFQFEHFELAPTGWEPPA
ncbi:cupin domain-containing protein [Ilumatobacter nonamiensis]|uniref:cupin domain-containing protein n=1 Tax=Ilumatobacter nonamiensis TaxID=467093 RepID=UPI00034DF5D9|nr:cupin domain-containing protein [Ilumatobacter nonamiensis]